MKKALAFVSVLAFLGIASGCSSERVTRTTTHESTVTVPADPIVTERQTTHTETRTNY